MADHKQYERVNEPMVDKLEHAAKSYEALRLGLPTRDFDPFNVARMLRESADRIRRMHAESKV